MHSQHMQHSCQELTKGTENYDSINQLLLFNLSLNTSVVQAEWEIQKQSRIEEHLLLWYAEVHTGTYITIISCCNVGLLLAISLSIQISDL